ncbi:MAG: SAP domain-containing protein [Gammaproteobacteria bacterium]|nr:SAP domain-containing protein [Gammaproteobacteria bacterium]MBU1480944.1 SAP domain-containing protein [Gammaproteobacteria bacterium]
MKITVIKNIAKSLGINPDNLLKTELIKTIQLKEGNYDCYGTAYDGECDQFECCWREDCFEEARLEGQI